MNILFVCSRNQWRSKTAEDLYKSHPEHNVTSVGTAKSARRRISQTDLQWADLIFVTEKKHREIIRSKFKAYDNENIVILEIPDDYRYMDPELIDILNDEVGHYFSS